MDDPDEIPPWAVLPAEDVPLRLPPAPIDEAARNAAALRWRLVLGRAAEEPLPHDSTAEKVNPDGARESGERDRALSALYDREQVARAHRLGGQGGGEGLVAPEWLRNVRQLFPREAGEGLEKDALVRYGLIELVTEPGVLRSLAPTQDLVKVILQYKDHMPPPVLAEARKIVRTVVDTMTDQLRRDTAPALSGASGRERGRPLRTFRNVDWRRTIRRNLRRWDPDRQRLVPDAVSWFHRQRARPRWRVIVAVDQSGSMLDSVIHASVLTAVLTGLPSVSVHLLLWDHRVVDLSAMAHDPLDVLFAAQLGGGTNLLPALRAAADLVTEPEHTVLAVVSDFHLHDEHSACLALAEELATAGVHGFGLCALDTAGRSVHDERFARALAGAGWWVGAVTPLKLAERLGPLLR